MIKDYLEREVELRGKIGIPCLLERFVLRNGEEFHGSPYPGKRMKPKMCYMNSTFLMEQKGMKYYEGLCLNVINPILPFQHAWCVKDGVVYDPTLAEPEKYGYLGIHVPDRDVHRITSETGYYGILSLHDMFNVDYINERDPEVMDIAKAVQGNAAKAMQMFSL